MNNNTVLRTEKMMAIGAPLFAINTADPFATMSNITANMNNKLSGPRVSWDFINGLRGLNDSGETAVKQALVAWQVSQNPSENDDYGNEEIDDPSKAEPIPALIIAENLPEKSILFVNMANRFYSEVGFVQALMNLRDKFKANHRVCILLAPNHDLPRELVGNVLEHDETKPTSKELAEIVREQWAGSFNAEVELADETVEKAVDELLGMDAFPAENNFASWIVKPSKENPTGIDFDGLGEAKRREVERSKLTMFRGIENAESIGGLSRLRWYLNKIINGPNKTKLVVFADEVEKLLAGVRGDNTGVAQNFLADLLNFLQDENATGIILVGPAGVGKSLTAKVAGAENGIKTVKLNTGDMKQSELGASEANLRNSLKTIKALSGDGGSLWIVTCNSIDELPPEFRARFTLGTWFVDRPTPEVRDEIWKIHLKKYGLPEDSERPDDTDWVGRDIDSCCDIAYRGSMTLLEAAECFTAAKDAEGDRVERLRNLAHGTFLSTEYAGKYKNPSRDKSAKKRQVIDPEMN